MNPGLRSRAWLERPSSPINPGLEGHLDWELSAERAELGFERNLTQALGNREKENKKILWVPIPVFLVVALAKLSKVSGLWIPSAPLNF